jgi:AraC-like DNA-binding protein
MQIRRRQPLEELIPVGAKASFAAFRFRSTHWSFAWHQHAEYELTWIVRGSGRRHVGASIEAFAPGDLVLLGPRLPHTWVSERQSGSKVESIVIQFRPEVLGPRWQESPELTALATMLVEAEQGLVFPSQDSERLLSLVTMPPGPLRMAAFLQVLGTLCASPRRALLTAPQRAERHADRWARLVDEAYAHPERLPPQAAAARRVGMAPSTFARAFHTRFGLAYRDWRIRTRLEFACRELAGSDSSIADIAFASGFASLSAFNRQFQAGHGMSPREWRARAGEDVNRA